MSQQSEKQTMNQLLSSFGQDVTNAVYRAADHKKEMTAIILEAIPDQEKVTKLRRSVLKYRAYKETVEANEGSTKDIPSLVGMATYQLTNLADLIQSMTMPLKEHEELVEKITETIRKENETAEIKVDVISNLLM